MSLFADKQKKVYNMKVKTTPENVKEANEALFHATMNLPAASAHCGMTQREMKHIFREYLKYNEPNYDENIESVKLNTK